jgi:hypothetical protein
MFLHGGEGGVQYSTVCVIVELYIGHSCPIVSLPKPPTPLNVNYTKKTCPLLFCAFLCLAPEIIE